MPSRYTVTPDVLSGSPLDPHSPLMVAATTRSPGGIVNVLLAIESGGSGNGPEGLGGPLTSGKTTDVVAAVTMPVAAKAQAPASDRRILEILIFPFRDEFSGSRICRHPLPRNLRPTRGVPPPMM